MFDRLLKYDLRCHNGVEKTALLPVGIIVGLLLGTSIACAASSLHDPMRPAGTVSHGSSSTHSGWHLGSTLTSPHRQLAIINGKTVGVGDHVDGATVLSIHAGTVTLRANGSVKTLRLIPATIKTAHSSS